MRCAASQVSLTTYNKWAMHWTWKTFSLLHLVDEVRYIISFQQIMTRPQVSLIQSMRLLTFLVSIFQTCLWLQLTFSINKSILCLFRSLFPYLFLLLSARIYQIPESLNQRQRDLKFWTYSMPSSSRQL